MHGIKRWLLGCCLLTLTGCATTSEEPAVPRPDAAHPKVVKLSFANGLAAVSYYYVADGGTAWLESHEPQDPHNATTPQVVKRTTRTPTAQQWRRFWRTLDGMHVERWKPIYLSVDDPEGMAMSDATDWRLTVATSSQTLRSWGDAFPYTGRPERTIALIRMAGAEKKPKFSGAQDNMIAQLEQAFDLLLQPQSPPKH